MNINVDPSIETQAILAGWPKPRLCGRFIKGGKRCEHYSFAPGQTRYRDVLYCLCCLKIASNDIKYYITRYWSCDGTMKP